MSVTVAEVLAQTIKEAGVEIVFGLPGGENVEVIEALRQQGLRFVLVRNESSAVFMADANTRLTGKPGICLTTLGPGAANALVGLAHAHLDRAPVLIITAQTNESYLPDYTHQVLDLAAIFQPVTKFSAGLSPASLRPTLHRALTVLFEGRSGPVHLSLSRETAGHVAEPAPPPPPASSQPTAAPVDLTPARRVLAQARRPVIIAGLGLEPERPYPALQALAETFQAPVIVTPKAKGALAEDHPLAAGTIGLSRTDPVYEILAEADGIIAVGFDVVELVKPWDQTAPLIWLAPWPNSDPILPAAAELVGPMQPSLTQLAGLPYTTDPTWGAARLVAFREKLSQRPMPKPAMGRMLPQAVLRQLRQHLPRQTLITTDVGSHKILTALEWPAYQPNRYLLSNGLSAMGFGLAAAIGAALTLEELTVCITGDAGLGMGLGELSLLSEYHLPLLVVVMHDAALDLIRSAQRRAGHPVFGTEFRNPDFSHIAAAYGLDFYRAANETTWAEAVQTAVAAGRPALLEALIDPIGYPTTPGVV